MARGKIAILWKIFKFLMKFYFETTCFCVKIEKFLQSFEKLQFE